MKINTKKIALIAIIFGVGLLLCNTFGLFSYKQITPLTPYILDDIKQQISEEEFWNNAYRKNGEALETYLARLTALVSQRMLLIDPKYAQPTFFENYILWALAKYWGRYEWTDTRKAVRLGGGFCSQHAIVFNNILRSQGIEARIIGLSGHVLNEVLIQNRWKVYDPDYNIIFGKSLVELEMKPNLVFDKYLEIGRPVKEAKHWEEVFASSNNNYNFRSSFNYSCLKSILEKCSFYLIWMFPIFLISCGVILLKYRLTKRST